MQQSRATDTLTNALFTHAQAHEASQVSAAAATIHDNLN